MNGEIKISEKINIFIDWNLSHGEANWLIKNISDILNLSLPTNDIHFEFNFLNDLPISGINFKKFISDNSIGNTINQDILDEVIRNDINQDIRSNISQNNNKIILGSKATEEPSVMNAYNFFITKNKISHGLGGSSCLRLRGIAGYVPYLFVTNQMYSNNTTIKFDKKEEFEYEITKYERLLVHLTHEIGHLFGATCKEISKDHLRRIGSTGIHCTNSDCVMSQEGDFTNGWNMKAARLIKKIHQGHHGFCKHCEHRMKVFMHNRHINKINYNNFQ